jgi:DnaJ-class molecular chaperone
MADPYTVLGVERGADADAIRKAYRKLARKYHPDVNKDPAAAEKFKEVNAANEILSDPEKRKNYDEFGDVSTRPGFDADRARAFRGGRGAPGGGVQWDFGGGGNGGVDVDMEDLLGSMFGGGGMGFDRRPRKGQDQQIAVSIDLLTAIRGGERHLTLQRPDGTTDSIRVPIPAGAKDGGKVRLKGQGGASRTGGPPGDLLVLLEVLPHPLLRRDGDDLEMDLPVTVLEAIQGASLTVPTPTGDVRVTVPAGVGSGRRMRLKGRGVQRKGRPGDLYLVVRPVVPVASDEETIEAAKVIEEAYEGDVRAGLRL